MAATVVFEGLGEITKDVTKAIVGKKKIGSEFGASSRELFGLLNGGSGPGRLERGGGGRRSIGNGGVSVSVRVRV